MRDEDTGLSNMMSSYTMRGGSVRMGDDTAMEDGQHGDRLGESQILESNDAN